VGVLCLNLKRVDSSLNLVSEEIPAKCELRDVIYSFTVLEVILYLQSMSTLSSWNAAELRLQYSLDKGNDHDSPQKDYGGASLAGIDFRFFVSFFAIKGKSFPLKSSTPVPVGQYSPQALILLSASS
jgi:hypothetical protein